MQEKLSVLSDPSVTKIISQNREIYLIGTAHVSVESAELVERAIDELLPDVVAVELCAARYDALLDPERWKKTNIYEIIKGGRAYVMIAQLILSGFQKRIGDSLKIQPGAEMMVAVNKANTLKITISTIDRNIRVTLKRAWSALGFWQKVKLCAALLNVTLSNEKINKEEIEKLKGSDVLRSALNELSVSFPAIKKPLIDERDLYLAYGIQQAQGNKIIAVLGAGHVPGIISALENDVTIEGLDEIPPPTLTAKILGWALPVLLVGLIVLGFWTAGASTGMKMITSWIYITSLMTGLVALLGLPHPLTLISCMVAAPFTTIHPLLAAGWVGGLVEAWIRKPTYEDLENLSNDITSAKGIWRNRVTRILLIVVLANTGASIGGILAGMKLFTLL